MNNANTCENVRIHRPTPALLATVIVFAATSLSLAQTAQPHLTIAPASVAPGHDVTLRLTIPLQPGYHIYAPGTPKPFYATRLIIQDPGPVSWQPPKYPPTKTFQSLGTTLRFLTPDPGSHSVQIIIPGKVNPTPARGTHTIRLSLTYQACTETLCLPPVIDLKLATRLTVSPISPVATPPPPPDTASAPVNLTKPAGYGTRFRLFSRDIDLQRASLAISLAVAFLAGLILNIMPCVLPVIPIKILQLARDAREHQRSLVALSCTFGLGVVAFFLAVGLAAIALRQTFNWGQQFQSPVFLMGVGLLLLWLALGMFGAYYLQLPAFISSRSPKAGSHIGAFLMGILAGVLSTPCSFAILGAAVAWAQTQRPPVSLLAFATIGVGMACPYVCLSAVPQLVNKIPTTGKWAEMFKQAMGFLLLAVAAFLIAALPDDRVLSALLYCVVFAFVVWLWGRLWQGKPRLGPRLAKVLACGALVISGYVILRPGAESLKWEPLSPRVLEYAKGSGKTYLVEFTAEWCLNCRTIEMTVFRNQRVIRELRDKAVILIRGDLTRRDDYVSDLLKEWTGQSGIPFTVVFRPGEQPVLLAGIYRPGDLIEAIRPKAQAEGG